MSIIINVLFLSLGIILGMLYFRQEKKKNRRTGIYQHNLISHPTNDFGKTENISVQAEIEEIGHTETKSKIKIISLCIDQSKYSTDSYKKRILSMINNQWVSSSDIEWIEETKNDIRDQKLKEILRK